MNPRTLRLAPLLVLLFVAALLATGLFNRHASQSPLIGQPMATFSVPSMVHNVQFSPHIWHGQVAMLSVFASWCEPCAVEHPVLMKLAGERRLPIYGLAWKDTPENVSAWLNKNGNPYQQVGFDRLGTTTVELGLTGVPETFIVGKDGRIYFHQKSPIDQATIDSVIIPLIARLNNEK